MVLSTLENDGHIMICGSLELEEGVPRNIKTILLNMNFRMMPSKD